MLPVRLELGMRAAMLLQEEYPLAGKDLTQIALDRWLFETMVCSFEGVGRFVMGLPADIRILGSPEFKKFIRSKQKSI